MRPHERLTLFEKRSRERDARERRRREIAASLRWDVAQPGEHRWAVIHLRTTVPGMDYRLNRIVEERDLVSMRDPGGYVASVTAGMQHQIIDHVMVSEGYE